MNWSELEALALVNLYGGYNEAAKNSGVHVSLLSKRVSRVEGELDLKLFTRATRKDSAALTRHGEMLMPLFQQMLNTHTAMLSRAKAYLNTAEDHISVGVVLTLGDLGSGQMMAGFCAQRPQTLLTTVVKSQMEVIRLLSEGQVDCAFFYIVEGAPSGAYWREMFQSVGGGEAFDVIPLTESTQIYVGLADSDPLAQGESVSLAQLRGRRLIFNRWNEDLRTERNTFFEGAGVNPEEYPVLYEDFLNRAYIYGLVSAGVGVLPQIFHIQDDAPGVKFLRLEGWNQRSRAFFAVRRYGGEALDAFARFVRANVTQQDPVGQQ